MRTVLVTGCSTGIGRATALAFARAGFTTWATARDPMTLTELEAAGCRTAGLDVTDEASMQAALVQTGAVDVLVDNAGSAVMGPAEEVPLEWWRRQFERNVFGLVRMTLVLPGMRERRWGRVITMSSMGGRLTFPLGAPYHGTKYAVEAISDALRLEVAGFGIKVVLIEPGPVRSAFEDTADEELRRYEDGPYRDVVRGFSKLMAETYRSRLAGTPEHGANAVVAAATGDSPRARIRVTPHAHVLTRARAVLPDRVWDAALASRLP